LPVLHEISFSKTLGLLLNVGLMHKITERIVSYYFVNRNVYMHRAFEDKGKLHEWPRTINVLIHMEHNSNVKLPS
jgi:hypothetical protein